MRDKHENNIDDGYIDWGASRLRIACVSEKDVLEKLQAEAARYPNESIVVEREEDVIWFGETRFNFEQG